MKLHLALWMMRRRVWRWLPSGLQNWAIHHYLLTFAGYRRLFR